MRVSFGEFVLDSECRLLERRGEPVHLSPKAFSVLELLIAERPRAVSKQLLLDRIWPDVVVEEQNVKTAIFEIRAALGDDSAVIRTVQRFGYAFAAEAQPQVAGDTGARLLTTDHAYLLRPGENLIGRDASCPIALTVTGVSRRHARIDIRDGRALLEDLGSKNGTWRNDERIATAVELIDGDSIRIGIVRLTFRLKVSAGKTTTLS